MIDKQKILSTLSALLPGQAAIRRILSGPLRGKKFCARFRIRPHYLLGQYEPEVTQAIIQNLHKGEVAFDIGANVGYETLIMAQAVSGGPHPGKVYSFEPGPMAFRMLVTNALLNSQYSIDPIQVALSDTTGIAPFSFFDYDVVSRLGDHKATYSDAQVTYVRVSKLDDFIEQFHLPEPDFVKIDVEGFELNVLRGMQRTLTTKHPTLMIEVHQPEGSDESAPDYGDQVVEFLSPLGYHCSFIQDQVPRQVLCTCPKA